MCESFNAPRKPSLSAPSTKNGSARETEITLTHCPIQHAGHRGQQRHHTNLDSNPISPLEHCATLGRVTSLSVPWFLHLENEDEHPDHQRVTQDEQWPNTSCFESYSRFFHQLHVKTCSIARNAPPSQFHLKLLPPSTLHRKLPKSLVCLWIHQFSHLMDL